jgi:hypothetical protein
MDIERQRLILRALKQAQISTFLSGLHEAQEEMIEELVKRSAAQGYPDANRVIRMIQEME